MKKYLNSGEAIKELNNLKLIKSETKDGFITIKKISRSAYEIKVFTDGEEEPAIMHGSLSNVMKTLNDSKLNDGFYIE